LKITSQSCIIEISEQDASPAGVEAAASAGRGRDHPNIVHPAPGLVA
jgi:hypothetical protein